MKIHPNHTAGWRGAALILGLGILSVAAQPYPNAVRTDHPIAYWRLQETGGIIAHDSVGSYNGGFTNVLPGLPGYNTGADLNELAAGFGSMANQSADSYVGGIPLDFATSGNATFSVEAWVNGSYQLVGAGIIGKGAGSGNEEFFLDCGGSGGAFRFYIRNAANTVYNAASTILPDGAWHHLVGVCDEANSFIYLYVDGRLSVSEAAAGGILSSPSPYLTIGARQSSASSAYDLQFNGSISEVAVYNYALSDNQVQTHYLAAGIPPVITLQPTNYVEVNEGATLTLEAAVYGTPPLSCQWTANGLPLDGQTNATLLLTNVAASLNYNYLNLTVTNIYGPATTAGTLLVVHSGPPVFLNDVQPQQLVRYEGLPTTYSVVVGGVVPISYQWLRNGAPISGATTSQYTFNTLLGTNTYSVIVSNGFNGGTVVTSASSTLAGVARPTGSYPATILADTPIAYWRLGEAADAAVANDFAGGHNGTYTSVQLGLPGYSPLDSDGAAGFGTLAATGSFMGETDNSSGGIPLIDFAQPQGSNAQFSIEAWVNGPPTQNPNGSAIVAKGAAGSEEFVMDASAPGNHFRFYIRKAGSGGTSAIYSGGSVVPDGMWHHLVGVCDERNGAVYFYVDGVNMGTITSIGGAGLYSSSVPVSVGAMMSGGAYNYQFVGTIDEVAIYNYALSQAQVQAHYNAAPIPPYFTLVPPATVSAVVGQNVTLSAAVLGSGPLTNQWFVNSTLLAGQTNLFLVLTNVQAGTNTYTLKASNAYGSVTNLPGTIVEVPAGSGPPQVVTDVKPLSGTFYSGLALTYSVMASGSAPLSYQWYFGPQAIPDATNSSFTLGSLDLTNAGTYYCHIHNSLGDTNSSTATLNVVAAPANAYSLTIIKDHPVAYYRLDETSGSPIGYDYVGGNNGFYSNTLFGVAGCYDGSFDADTAVYFGTGGALNSLLGCVTNVDFSVPNGQNGAFSVEAWAKGPSGVNQLSGGAIVGKGVGNGDEQFALDAHFGFRFYVRNAAGVTVAGAQASALLGGTMVGSNWQMDNKWHHVVGVCDQVNSNILLYVDGKLIGPDVIVNGVVPPLVAALDVGYPGTGTNGYIYAGAGIRKPSNTYYNGNMLSIGSRNKNSTSPGYQLNFNGAVDEVGLYNYALTPAQVYSHYAVALQIPPTLHASFVSGHLVLTWSGAGATTTLQSAPSVSGPWVTVPNAVSPYSVTNSGTQQFYRLKLF